MAEAGGQSTQRDEWAAGEDHHLRKSVGFCQLTAISFSGVIGSGWLLAALYAARRQAPTRW